MVSRPLLRSLFTPFYLLVFIFLLVNSQTVHAVTPYSLIFDGKELTLSPAEKVELGRVKQGDVCSSVIRVKNQSEQVLWIANVRGGCGLSAPSWPRKPLAPGEEALIQVRYDSSRPGIINRHLTINANTTTSVTILRVSGEILSR
jgi:hypothetical protein